MEPSADELAGVVDLFGALRRATLCEALSELAFRAGEDRAPGSFEEAVGRAVGSYHLLPVDAAAVEGADEEGDDWLVVGPVAFPTLPGEATDLPHIMDAAERAVDRELAAEAAERQFRADAAAAVEAGADDRVATLLDASYELEAWGPVDLGEARARLDAAREGTN